MQVSLESPIVLAIEAQLIQRERLDVGFGKVLHQRIARQTACKEVGYREDRC